MRITGEYPQIFVLVNHLDGTRKTEIHISPGTEWVEVQIWVPLWANSVSARPELEPKLGGGQCFSSPEAWPLPVPEGRHLEEARATVGTEGH